VCGHGVSKRSGETFPQQPGVPGRHAAAHRFRFEQDDIHAGDGKGQGAGGACQAPANDRDSRGLFPA